MRVRFSRQGHGRVLEWFGVDDVAPTVKADVRRGGGEFGRIEVELDEADVLNARGRSARSRLRAQRSGALGQTEEVTDRPIGTITSISPSSVYLDAEADAAAPVDEGGKPPFRPPTLAEVLAAEPNGLTCVSTFSGAGGSSIGYRLAGYRVAAAFDLNPVACASYRANFPDTAVLERDARELTGADLLEAAGVDELDLLDGSPPCTPFSSAGRRQRTWGRERAHAGKRQVVDDLFLEFARLLGEVRPRAFVAENVAGLARGVAVGYFREIRSALEAHGYHVEVRLLDAQWMGVPQARQRLIFAGVRDDVWELLARPGGIPWPKPLPYRYSVREALPWLDPSQAVFATRGTPWGTPERIADGTATPVEEELAPGDPARTITAAHGKGHEVRLVHDTQGRNQAADPERSLDEPVDSITAGKRGWNADHFRVEMIAGNDAFEPEWGDLDRPTPAILAAGARTSGELRIEHDTGGQHFSHGDVTGGPANPIRTTDQAHFKVVREDEHGVTLKRKFTILEVKRLFAFPDDYRLEGTYAEQWAQLGNSVAPPMTRAVGEALAPLLQGAGG